MCPDPGAPARSTRNLEAVRAVAPGGFFVARAAYAGGRSMPMRWSPEVKAEVRRLVEKTRLSYAEIEKRTGVSETTIRYWVRTLGWTRPTGAPTRRRFGAEESAAILRALAAGASVRDVALIAGRHPETIRKLHPGRGAGPAEPEAEPVPAAVAELCEALTAGGIGRDEFLHHAPQAFGFIAARALMGHDPQVHRTAQALAQLAASAAKIPAAAAVRDEPYTGPETYAETNALIEELTQRLCEFGVLNEDGSLPDPPPGP
jgi:transposase-like protein